MALDLERVVQLGKRCGPGDIGHDLLKAALDGIVRFEILNAATPDAHQVMVVSAQPFGELIARESG